MSIKFSKIEISDTELISEIHYEELGEGIVSLFGLGFINRMYLKLIGAGNWGFLAKDEGSIIGFIFATKVEVSLQKCLTFSSIIFFFLKIVRNPKKFLVFLVAFKEFFLLKGKVKIKPTDKTIELSHIAVRTNHKGKGIGEKLIEMLEKKAKENGFLFIFTRTHNNRLSNYYVRNKNAKLVEIIPLGELNSNILKWKI